MTVPNDLPLGRRIVPADSGQLRVGRLTDAAQPQGCAIERVQRVAAGTS